MPQSISVTEFRPLWEVQENDPKSLIIDVRTPAEFRERHVEGAKNIPLNEIKQRLSELEPFDHVYVLCKSGARSNQACAQTAALDKDMIVVEGGTDAWHQAQFPVIENKVRLPLMRQVMLTAGLLVLLGSVGSAVIDVRLIYLTIFVGAGLTFSGVTGWCGMAMLLGKMPWNR